MLQGDRINTEREPDERVRVETVEMKRTKDGLVKRTRYPLEMRWKGLWDKNSDKLYSLDQLLPQEEFTLRHQQNHEERMWKYRKKLDGAREAMEKTKNFLKKITHSFQTQMAYLPCCHQAGFCP